MKSRQAGGLRQAKWLILFTYLAYKSALILHEYITRYILQFIFKIFLLILFCWIAFDSFPLQRINKSPCWLQSDSFNWQSLYATPLYHHPPPGYHTPVRSPLLPPGIAAHGRLIELANWAKPKIESFQLRGCCTMCRSFVQILGIIYLSGIFGIFAICYTRFFFLFLLLFLLPFCFFWLCRQFDGHMLLHVASEGIFMCGSSNCVPPLGTPLGAPLCWLVLVCLCV